MSAVVVSENDHDAWSSSNFFGQLHWSELAGIRAGFGFVLMMENKNNAASEAGNDHNTLI
jgi:hypothetical protein